MRLRIAQCLCPKRHAIMALGVKEDVMTDTGIIEALRTGVEAMLVGIGSALACPIERINPWCALCGAPARDWIYEARLTIEFQTFEDGVAALKELECAQMMTHAMADLLGASYDAQRKARLN